MCTHFVYPDTRKRWPRVVGSTNLSEISPKHKQRSIHKSITSLEDRMRLVQSLFISEPVSLEGLPENRMTAFETFSEPVVASNCLWKLTTSQDVVVFSSSEVIFVAITPCWCYYYFCIQETFFETLRRKSSSKLLVMFVGSRIELKSVHFTVQRKHV